MPKGDNWQKKYVVLRIDNYSLWFHNIHNRVAREIGHRWRLKSVLTEASDTALAVHSAWSRCRPGTQAADICLALQVIW
jgi:hypothetical protein